MLETIEEGSTVELAIQSVARHIRPSDPAGDDIAVKWLVKALEICEGRNINLLLYSDLSFWVERHEDAVRLCQRLNHPNLGIVFCGYHWYAVDGEDIQATLGEVAPYLRQVNLSGSRRSPLGFGNVATIEPLDVVSWTISHCSGRLKRSVLKEWLAIWDGWKEATLIVS
ncbi:sugar phosphate isomerase/epimerase [Bacillus methanolicus]|uniref:sugar phosphate isomerase/epimerase n=1 Tax=Bacillus methanolicus TaxID=1471 RepID=UPI00200E2B95|nr:sugar phosphate isomerase/epimerase [Bacillus methanolicus]